MNPEQLLQMLREQQLDDEAIKTLLSDTLASLEGPAEEEPVDDEAEKAKASELLGVQL